MIIPYTELEPDTLQALLEEIVTRDGTDYGEHELTTQQKVNRAMALLKNEKLFIFYSELHDTCTLQTKEAFDIQE
ncbi:MAG: YheU family protein [Gammaproteobacteria bacterium]|nr:YheU family protein [Gammaproteobacteria bacterium]